MTRNLVYEFCFQNIVRAKLNIRICFGKFDLGQISSDGKFFKNQWNVFQGKTEFRVGGIIPF